MNVETNLTSSCKNNVFPSTYSMSKFGLNGEGLSNPVDILNCYKIAIFEDGISEEELLNCENINILLDENTFFLKEKPFYKRVVESGGIKISNETIVECKKCCYNGKNFHLCKQT